MPPARVNGAAWRMRSEERAISATWASGRASGETPPVRMRPLTTADRDLLETFVLLAVFAPDRPLPAAPLTEPAAARWLEPWNAADVGVVLAGEDDAAGLAMARRVKPAMVTGPDGGAIPEVLIAVRAELRARGHGGALLAALTQAASDAGHPELVLTVSPRNPARRLYLRHGFSLVSQTDGGLDVLASGTPPANS